MASGLDIWISKPGSVCRVDDDTWTVTVYDAHLHVFEWADVTYADLEAPAAHWSGAIPPGTYVVRAVRKGKPAARTDHAVVAVDCGHVACVRLFVAPPRKERGEREPGDRGEHESCDIDIEKVSAVGGPDRPEAIRVRGTAAGCERIVVTLSCRGDEEAKLLATPTPDGHWKVLFEDVEKLECRCGGPVHVRARCVENERCGAELDVGELRCEEDEPPR